MSRRVNITPEQARRYRHTYDWMDIEYKNDPKFKGLPFDWEICPPDFDFSQRGYLYSIQVSD